MYSIWFLWFLRYLWITFAIHSQMNHYRKGSACYPCDCYEFGSYGRSCDMSTGQCHCRSNVVGRQCDTCSSKSAEVTLRGCEVIYDSCPRSFKGRIWWERTGFNAVAVQDCPSNMVGKATRYCNETDGWDDPNLENCASVGFAELVDQVGVVFSFSRENILNWKSILKQFSNHSVIHHSCTVVQQL